MLDEMLTGVGNSMANTFIICRTQVNYDHVELRKKY